MASCYFQLCTPPPKWPGNEAILSKVLSLEMLQVWFRLLTQTPYFSYFYFLLSVVFNLSKNAPTGSSSNGGSTNSHREGEGDSSDPSGSPEDTASDQSDPSGSTHPAPPPQSSGSGTDASGGGFTRNAVASGGKVQPLPNALKLATGKTTAKKKEASREDAGRVGSSSRKRKLTALEEIRMMEEQRKEKMNRRDNWLTEGVVVKVVHRKLGERYHRRKGIVEEVQELFTGIVRMADSGDKIRIDQAHLETVIPAIGELV